MRFNKGDVVFTTHRGIPVQARIEDICIVGTEEMGVLRVETVFVPCDGDVRARDTFVTRLKGVEPLCVNFCDIGDRVRSRVGWAYFTVTGFEVVTNRIICKPDSTSKCDRARYAYKLSELEVLPKGIKLEVGKYYKVYTKNHICTTLACQSFDNPNDILLVYVACANRGETNYAFRRARNRFIEYSELKRLGIHNIMEVEVIEEVKS